jgi:hypothetical protein
LGEKIENPITNSNAKIKSPLAGNGGSGDATGKSGSIFYDDVMQAIF